MKTWSMFVSALLLCGCASGDISRPNPAPLREGVQRCVASSSDRNACAQYANQRCGMGFEVFEMEAPGDDGVVRRGYHFKCLP